MSPVIDASFAGKDPQLMVSYESSPPCSILTMPTIGHHNHAGLEIQAIKRPRTRSAAARQVINAHEQDIVTNQNV